MLPDNQSHFANKQNTLLRLWSFLPLVRLSGLVKVTGWRLSLLLGYIEGVVYEVLYRRLLPAGHLL